MLRDEYYGMSVRISVLGHVASIQNGEWSCDDAAVLSRIREVAPGYFPDIAQAEEVARDLAGEVLEVATDENADIEIEVDEEGRTLIH
jgi:hypothetical protein